MEKLLPHVAYTCQCDRDVFDILQNRCQRFSGTEIFIHTKSSLKIEPTVAGFYMEIGSPKQRVVYNANTLGFISADTEQAAIRCCCLNEKSGINCTYYPQNSFASLKTVTRETEITLPK